MLKNKLIPVLLCSFSFAFSQSITKSKLTKITHAFPNEVEVNERSANAIQTNTFPFFHGVASGDPTTSAVIIWTRVSPKNEEPVNVSWVVATDNKFNNIVKSGNFTTDSSRDYTVKIDVTNLKQATTYYYKFNALGKESIIGRTKTVPSDNVKQIRFAVASCSNYQNGYFNAYDRIAERNDLDAVVHLGDYIYEYKSGDYGYSPEVGREHEPKNEIVTLDDYRVRHSFYKLDPSLQNIHQQHPFIVTWDDHEFANDAYIAGAENHQPETEGDWNLRKFNAKKAYFEWMPIRDNANNQVYRKIQYGNLLDLIMLDTRVEGRDKQLSDSKLFKSQEVNLDNLSEIEKNKILLKNFFEESFNMDTANQKSSNNLMKETYEKFVGYMEKVNWDFEKISQVVPAKEVEELRNNLYNSMEASNAKSSEKAASIKLISDTQLDWFKTQLSNSKTKWKIIGNQVLMMPVFPLKLYDTWNGYEEQRTNLFNHISNNKIKNVVVLTGDIHLTLVSDIPKSKLGYWPLFKKGSMGGEFVTPSITSSNLNEFTGFTSSFLNWLVEFSNPHIKKANLSDHGYFILDVTNDKVQADWFYVNDVKTKNNGQWYSHSYIMNNGDSFIKSVNRPSTSISGTYPDLITNNKIAENNTIEQNLVVIGNYPNPSQDITNLHFSVSKTSNLMVNIFNEKGIKIDSIYDNIIENGLYNLEYNLENLNNGLYLIQVINGEEIVTKKVVVKH